MSVLEKIKIINDIAEENFIDKMFFVGGVPRDYAMGLKEIRTDDIDVTTNTPDCPRLGVLSADYFNAPFKMFDDGHVKVSFNNFSIDFSQNFISDDVVNYLKKNKKTINDQKMLEVYSRDFTINTLHQDPFSKEIFDFLNFGLKDIDEKIIDTPVAPEITLSDDPRRIFRAIYFSCKYNFKIHNDIKKFVIDNNLIINDNKIKNSFVTNIISKAMGFDPEKTVELLFELGIVSRVPLVGLFKDFLIRNKLILDYLDSQKGE